jgi:predicted DNA-binding transcriptional regulator YafY
VAAAIDRLRDNGEELTSQTLARELGVGERQARRYLMKREPV